MNNWKELIFGKYNISDVLVAVKHDDWQLVRKSMLGTSMEFKYNTLKTWLEINEYNERSRIQVTNYVNALKRGGLLPAILE
jgi:hypothetical protein